MFAVSFDLDRSGVQAVVFAGICRHAAERLLMLTCAPAALPEAAGRLPESSVSLDVSQSAFPEVLGQISVMLENDQSAMAEGLLQKAIGELTGSVPPRALQERDWLMLALFALRREDMKTAAAFLRRAATSGCGSFGGTSGCLQLRCLLQLAHALSAVLNRQEFPAEELLDELEASAGVSGNRCWMGLILQLRVAASLLGSRFGEAWRLWQAAMLLQRSLSGSSGSWMASAEDVDWLRGMAQRESAIQLN